MLPQSRDALKRDDDTGLGYIEVQSETGAIYLLYEFPPVDIIVRDGNWIVYRSRSSYAPFLVEHPAYKGVVFDVYRARDPRQGRWSIGPSVESFQAEGFRRLNSCPDDVFQRGQIASPNVNDASEAFEPGSDNLQPIPSSMRETDDHHFENITIEGRRFARLTPAGVSAREAAREAAVRAERERKAMEVEAARLKQEEDERQAEEARGLAEQKVFDTWWASLPLPPGTLVLDIRDEINPCLGRVEYEGLYQGQDGGWYFDGPAGKLPKFVKINYGHRPRCEFLIERRGLKEQFIPYEGPDVALGTRIARADALNGRPDPFPPLHGDLVRATIDFIGKGYNPDIGQYFIIEHALEFLSEKSPYQSGFAAFHDDDDDGGDWDDEGRGERYGSRQRVSLSLEERYPDLFEYDGRSCCWRPRSRLNGPWLDYPWRGHDRKLLEAEERRRIAANAKWDKCKKALLHFMKVLCADLSQVDAGGLYGGALCHLVMTEAELDSIEEFLRRKYNCEVSTGYSRDDIDREMLDRHTLPSGRLDEVLKIWRKHRGSGPLFISATDHLVAVERGPNFIIDGVLPAAAVSLLVGPKGLGKSTGALQMAMAVASGESFAELRVENGNAAYLFGEGEEVSIRKQKRDANFESDRLLVINARNYNDNDMEAAFYEALIDLEGHPELRLLVIDALEAFVPNSSDSNAIYRFTNRVAAFAEKTGAAVLVIHHDTKDVTAENATSSRQVAAKAKGSGRIVNAARAIITLHRKGENRVLTLAISNILLTTPRLQNSLEFAADYETGLWRVLNEPIVAAGKPASVAPRKLSSPESKIDKPAASSDGGDDARKAADVVNRIQCEMGRKVAYAGAKSLYNLKGKGDLVGWTRARCERAHRRAVELGLIEAILTKRR